MHWTLGVHFDEPCLQLLSRVAFCRSLNSFSSFLIMSDSEEITRKLPTGEKVVEKVSATTVVQNEGGSATTEHVEKKRKTVDGNIKSMFQRASKQTETAEAEAAPSIPKAPAEVPPAEQAILDLEKTMGEDWYEALKDEFTKPYFRSIRNFLIAETRKKSVIYPATENIYNWSRLTPIDKVKVIVVGQDPYHGPNQAHGLSFSVLPPTRPPPSLVNIYKEMKKSVPGFEIPKSGDLTPLAEAGVLWLNTSLTVRAGQAASHSKIGWEKFTRAAMQAVLSRPGGKGVVFLVWGAHAQKAITGFDTKKNKVLKSVHPSPLSASKGFFGCNHFIDANKWIAETHGPDEVIDWTVINPK